MTLINAGLNQLEGLELRSLRRRMGLASCLAQSQSKRLTAEREVEHRFA